MFRIAGTIGKSVGWIERNVSSREVSEWAAYFRLIDKPEDERRAIAKEPDPQKRLEADALAAFGVKHG